MKYIVNETNTCGAASISDEARNNLLESLGHAPNKLEEPVQAITESVTPQAVAEDTDDMPSLYSWDDAVFALDEEVFEIEGDLFLKAIELDNGTRTMLGESHADLFINEVKFEEAPFSLGDIYDFGGEIFIKLDEAGKKGDESDVKGKKGDKPDFTADDRKGDKSKTKPGKKDFVKGDDDEDEEEEECNEVDKKLKKLKKKLKEEDEDGPSDADLKQIEREQAAGTSPK
jgi:hypothetical protein|tara:strand:+ start:987 stop:1673 length:687 start_codon:yes stop_codon:yes gene_type:complete